MITKEQITNYQESWGNGVVKIGSLKDNRSECEKFTSEFLDSLMLLKAEKSCLNPLNARSNNLDPLRLRLCPTLLPAMTGRVMKIKVLQLILGLKLGLKIVD